MPKFGNASKQRLATCHPDLQKVLNEAIKYIDFSVVEGYRTQADQEKYVKEGKSKTLNSKHLLRYCPEYGGKYSYAVDVVPYFSTTPHTDFNDREEFCLLAGVILSTAKRLKEEGKIKSTIGWGGKWNRRRIKDNSFFDGPHFQIDD